VTSAYEATSAGDDETSAGEGDVFRRRARVLETAEPIAEHDDDGARTDGSATHVSAVALQVEVEAEASGAEVAMESPRAEAIAGEAWAEQPREAEVRAPI